LVDAQRPRGRLSIPRPRTPWEAALRSWIDPDTPYKERAMRLNTTQIEQTLTQFPAEPIPADHPACAKLESLFGDHTFFLDGNGLNIVEPIAKEERDGGPSCVVMNVASWADASGQSLQPHAPESTEQTVSLEIEDPPTNGNGRAA
jgi:hypothetical protein